MKIDLAPEIPAAGFNFENCRRNATMINKGYVPPKVRKTGTTIVGIIFKDGVILGADTRATEGPIVADKNCDKIHYLAKNMYCCGAGTAADTVFTTNLIASNLELLRLNTGRVVPVATANTLTKRMLFNYQGHISAALIVGGVDSTGPHLYQIHPHGSSDSLLYTTMGSGSLAAMAVFEARYREDINEEDGKILVRDAIAAGIFNDLGSGSNVDLCILRNNYSVDYLRGYEYANEKGKRTLDYTFKTGTTATLKSTIRNIEITEHVKMIPVGGATPMDTD